MYCFNSCFAHTFSGIRQRRCSTYFVRSRLQVVCFTRSHPDSNAAEALATAHAKRQPCKRSGSGWLLGEHTAQLAATDAATERVATQRTQQASAAATDGQAGTLCCWALLNLSMFEPTQVRCTIQTIA